VPKAVPVLQKLEEWIKSLSFPSYIRRSYTSAAAGDRQAGIEANRDAIFKNILAPDQLDKKVSLYRVKEGFEVIRILVALQMTDPSSGIRLFAISEEEIKSEGLLNNTESLKRTPSNCNNRCSWMRNHHYDLDLADKERLAFAARIASNWRPQSPGVSRKHIQDEIESCYDNGCYAANENSTSCSECDPDGRDRLA
jgi:hypothetical protein